MLAPVARDLIQVIPIVPTGALNPNIPILAFWKPDGGTNLECREYNSSGVFVSTLATKDIGFTPTGSFSRPGENLAHRSCFVGDNANSNALLVMADEVADVIAVWDINTGLLTSSTYQVQGSPTSISEPVLCGNVGDGNAYILHTENDGADDTFYVHKVDHNSVTLIASFLPSVSIGIEMVGFTGAGQAESVGAIAMVIEDPGSSDIMHEIALPGGGLSTRGLTTYTGSPVFNRCFARDTGFATPGCFYGEHGGTPSASAVELDQGSYAAGLGSYANAAFATAGAVPVDAGETNGYSLNTAATSLSCYDFDRTASPPEGTLKHLKWKDAGDDSISNADPTLTILPKDFVDAGSPGTENELPDFMQMFGLDPAFP